MDTRALLVGVDTYPGSRPALAWAAAECQLRGAELVILHAIDEVDSDLISTFEQPSASAQAVAAQRVLDSHAGQARRIDPVLNIRLELSPRPAAEALIDASANFALTVVGTNTAQHVAQFMVGTVGHRVAARARSPVAIVPESDGVDRRHSAGTVVVGLAPTPAGRAALRLALAEARLRGCAVKAIRAGSTTGDSEHLRALIARANSDVTLEVVLTDSDPADVLLAEADKASLAVLGGHHNSEPWSVRLGGVTTAVLRHVRCPVLLVGHGEQDDLSSRRRASSDLSAPAQDPTRWPSTFARSAGVS
ncbi:MAG: universal stress protein [Actinomycetota bacterium]|nr:universal stress protein [Actinomycetota bacterium]